jgi:hypothetical protein
MPETEAPDDDVEKADLGALLKDFNPDQPRDDHGRWSSGGPGEYNTPAQKALERFEKNYSNFSTEFGQASLPDGTLLFKQELWGDARHIEFSPTELQQMSNKDVTFSHNHPINLSLSPPDIVFAAHCNLKEIRAVHEGTVYAMARGEKGWPSAGVLRDSFNTIRQTVVDSYKASGTVATGNQFAHDLMNETVAAYKGHMAYAKITRA